VATVPYFIVISIGDVNYSLVSLLHIDSMFQAMWDIELLAEARSRGYLQMQCSKTFIRSSYVKVNIDPATFVASRISHNENSNSKTHFELILNSS
jgi:hypothetical protein